MSIIFQKLFVISHGYQLLSVVFVMNKGPGPVASVRLATIVFCLSSFVRRFRKTPDPEVKNIIHAQLN